MLQWPQHTRRDFMRLAGSAGLGAALGGMSCSTQPPWNVLFISVDDLNNWVGCLGIQPDARTPNIDRLAKSGTLFTHAYSSGTTCNSSRTTVLTGVSSTTSGIYSNKSASLREVMPDAVTLPQHFRENGYSVLGGGKIFHDRDDRSWDELYMPKHKGEFAARVKQDRFGFPGEGLFNWGPLDMPDDETWDGQLANWAVGQLERPHERPFFLGVGFFRPHLPWFAPREYFRPFKPTQLSDLPYLKRDVEDIPRFARLRRTGRHHGLILRSKQWRMAIASYLACMHYVDAMFGKLLDALERGPHAERTIVVLWGDHGFHLGQKGHWQKFLLWEQTTQVPLIVAAPGLVASGARCEQPVSLSHLYATLSDLCDIPRQPADEGRSLTPLLRDAGASWDEPVISTIGAASHAVRTERWRYIRYADGSEELYDHDTDPNEWANLAMRPEYGRIKLDLATLLPSNTAPEIERKRRRPSSD